MPTFTTLVKFSPQIRTAPDPVGDLLEALSAKLASAGGSVLDAGDDHGSYDLRVLYEAADDATASAVWLEVAPAFGYSLQTIASVTENGVEVDLDPLERIMFAEPLFV